MEKEWLFVAGMPRSGTTLMRFLLNAHPDCHILHEIGLPVALMEAVDPPTSAPSGYYDVRFTSRNPPHDMVERHWPLPRITHYHGNATVVVQSFCDGFRAHFYPEALVFGDKLPRYSVQWEILRSVFPSCKIIVTDRDMQAAAESAMNGWGRALGNTIEETITSMRYNRENALNCPGAHWVKLEELNKTPKPLLEGVLAYAGLDPGKYDWDAAMERFAPGRENIN